MWETVARYFRRRQWDLERARELDSHIEMEIASNIERGMTPGKAEHAARLKLGNPTLIREEIYRMNTIGFLETIWQDLRYAVRSYRGSPGFTLVALISLMLGIGATTALFSVVYGVLIAPYPYYQPERIWAPFVHDIKTTRANWRNLSIAEFQELLKLPGIATAMGTGVEQVLLGGDRVPESFNATRLTPDAFNFLNVAPVIGRTLQPSDVKPNGEPEPVTVITFKLWHRFFGGNPDALGQKLVLNGIPHTIVGVMPPRFGWYTNEAFWLPLGSSIANPQRLSVIMRLATGLNAQAVEEQLNALYARFAAVNPRDFPRDGFQVKLRNYLDMTQASGTMRSSLSLLFLAVGFLLLIACANVASLQVARTAARAREIGVRLSIGGGRGRIARQLLTESLLLSLVGGALGIVFAFGLTQAIVELMPPFYIPNEARVTVNPYVLAFAVGISMLTGLLFGLAPAIYGMRQNLTDSLREGSRGSGIGLGGSRIRNVLAITEVALSVVLLAGAGLAIRTFLNLQSIDIGFKPEGVLNAGLPLQPARYNTLESRNQFAQALVERVRILPGVQSVSVGNGGLPFGGPPSPFTLDGQRVQGTDRIMLGLVNESFLRTTGMRFLRGREFTEAEVVQGRRLAHINEAAARLWPAGQDPIGRLIRLDILVKSPDPSVLIMPGPPELTVIGVVGDTRNAGLSRDPQPAVYLPYTIVAPNFRQIAIRTSGDPAGLANALRREVLAIDKEQPIQRPITFDEILGQQTVQPRFNMTLFTFFAFLGVFLAAAGIFSVISYHVARRSHEIGIRVALGATVRDVLTLIATMSARFVSIGVALGLGATHILIRTAQTQIFDLKLFDFATGAGVVGVIAIVAIVACYMPARNASKLDPAAALRQD